MNGWLALLPEATGDLQATAIEAQGRPAWLCGWRSRRRPHPSALRVDERLLDPEGLPCRISLLLLERGARPICDDPVAVHVRRRVLRDGRLTAVSILTDDPVHLAGAISIARSDQPEELLALRDDAFARLGVVRILDIGPGLLGWLPLAAGPVVERYAGAPWPSDKW